MKIVYLLFVFNAIFTKKINLINNNNLDQNINFVKIIGTILLSLPIIFRNGEKCNSDNDCPNIMKCCQIGNHKYCCTPNNYVKLELAYIKNYIR
jgi:hypothetical protein